MKRDLRFLIVSFLLVGLFSVFALGQTTGNLDITVKDAAGAVVPNVALTIISSGESTGFKRTVNTDNNGFARVIQIPPGIYTVTAAATSGFKEKTLNEVQVSLGQTTPVNFEMSTTVNTEVTVTSGDVAPID